MPQVAVAYEFTNTSEENIGIQKPIEKSQVESQGSWYKEPIGEK